MPFDLIAYYQSQTATALSSVNGVTDDIYRVAGADIYVQDVAPFLSGVLHIGVSTPKQVEFRQPSLLIPHRFYKAALAEQTSLNSYDGFTDLSKRPLPLFPGEKLNAYVQNASAEVSLIVAALASGKTTQAALDAVNPTHFITGVSTTDTVAGTWTKQDVTWDQSLPQGRYAIVGMKAYQYKAANPMVGASRIILLDTTWRPGVPYTCMIGANTIFDKDSAGQQFGMWPLMPDISFRHDQMPAKIETITPAAMTDANFQLLLQKIK